MAARDITTQGVVVEVSLFGAALPAPSAITGSIAELDSLLCLCEWVEGQKADDLLKALPELHRAMRAELENMKEQLGGWVETSPVHMYRRALSS